MKYLWLDMEMTGLEPAQHVPLEVAAVVTSSHSTDPFCLGEEVHFVVRQPQLVLDQMDEWCKKTHGKSGLSAKVPNGVQISEIESALCDFVTKHFGTEKAILAGNSIGQDRRFLRRYFPKFESLLHYRMLDVSSWKVVFEGIYEKKYHKQNKHTAVQDIHESIAELNYYMSFLKLEK